MNILEPWRTFLTVANEGSISRAARKLRVSQPAVSQQMKQLEQIYRTPLFDRRRKGMALTEAGRILQREASRINDLIVLSLEQVGNAADAQSGTLAMGASMTIAEYVVPTALAMFRRLRPLVRVRLFTGNSEEIGRQVANADLLIGLIEAPLYDTRIIQRAFLDDELGAIVSPRHSLAKRETLLLRDLTGDRLLVRETGSGTRTVLEEALRTEDLSLRDFSVFLESNNPQTLKALVESGYGISIMSKWAVQDAVADGRLVFVPFANRAVKRSFLMAWREEYQDDPLLAAFTQVLDQLNWPRLD
ncbi:MAG: LysR substrate-binding domain-containing protein [Bacilli bacterium]